MAFANPDKNIAQLGIAEGMQVADFGAGSGFYTIAAARKVGEEGKVYAIDVQRSLLPRLKAHIQEEGLDNVEVIWGDIAHPGGTTLKDTSVNVVIISNVLFQAGDDIVQVCQEAYRVLRPGGRGLVIEWSDSFGGIGPKPEHVIKEETVRSALEGAGFRITGDIDAGAHHYGLIVKKPAS